jgi:hypothetical protein
MRLIFYFFTILAIVFVFRELLVFINTGAFINNIIVVGFIIIAPILLFFIDILLYWELKSATAIEIYEMGIKISKEFIFLKDIEVIYPEYGIREKMYTPCRVFVVTKDGQKYDSSLKQGFVPTVKFIRKMWIEIFSEFKPVKFLSKAEVKNIVTWATKDPNEENKHFDRKELSSIIKVETMKLHHIIKYEKDKNVKIIPDNMRTLINS